MLYILITILFTFLLIKCSFDCFITRSFSHPRFRDDNPTRDGTKHDIKVYIPDYSNNDNDNNNNNNNPKLTMIKITLMEMIIDWCIMIWYAISELENPWICVKLWKTYLIFFI